MNMTENFVQAFLSGKICLHPTDGLPGLSFDPENEECRDALLKLKGYTEHRPFISLVSSLDIAKGFWQDLPGMWEKRLKSLWPAPLSIIWKASDSTPACLISKDSYVAFRVPELDPKNKWLFDAMKKIAKPLPSSSINLKGEEPARNYIEAAHFLASSSSDLVFKPEQKFFAEIAQKPASSTIIKINEDASYTLIRQGAYTLDF